MATIQELLDYGKQQLDCVGNEYSKYERKVLLETVTGVNYMFMLTNPTEEVSKEQEELYKSYIQKRCENYPLQYILGEAHFMDFSFFVNENVLVPRNDTEILVELAQDILEKEVNQADSSISYNLLDLCCGSGCIGISLKLYYKSIKLDLADLSQDALQVTKQNLERHSVTANIIHTDLFENIHNKYQMIVCNPPYIEKQVIETLSPEVKDFEPRMALDGGEDGLDFYRIISKESIQYLNSGGWLIYEIGYNQGNAVKALLEENGYKDVAIVQDYAGLDRVVYGHL